GRAGDLETHRAAGAGQGELAGTEQRGPRPHARIEADADQLIDGEAGPPREHEREEELCDAGRRELPDGLDLAHGSPRVQPEAPHRPLDDWSPAGDDIAVKEPVEGEDRERYPDRLHDASRAASHERVLKKTCAAIAPRTTRNGSEASSAASPSGSFATISTQPQYTWAAANAATVAATHAAAGATGSSSDRSTRTPRYRVSSSTATVRRNASAPPEAAGAAVAGGGASLIAGPNRVRRVSARRMPASAITAASPAASPTSTATGVHKLQRRYGRGGGAGAPHADAGAAAGDKRPES